MSIILITTMVVFQVLFIILGLLFYETLAAAFGIGGWPLFIVLLIFSFTFISASLLASRYKNRWVRYYHKLAMYWFAFVGPLICACIAFLILENISLAFRWNLAPSIAGGVSFGAAILLYIYGIWKGNAAQLTSINVAIPGIPDAWRGKKIVFISDIHLGDEYGARFAEKIVRRIAPLKPEAIFIGGDLFDGVKCDPEILLAPFKKFQAPQGVYFASGNHEYIRDSELLFEAVRKAGIVILKNEKKTILGVDFLGVDFKDTDEREDYEKVLKGMAIDAARPNIFIKHIPDNLDIAEHAGISLQLSGHTHHGQIFPLSFITHRYYKGYDYGLKQFGKMWVYTSSGIGVWGAPFRLGTKSEVVLIEFK